MNFVGHTRFSLFEPYSKDWRGTHVTSGESIERYKADLFSRERLEGRARVFFNHTLPNLEQARDDYHLIHVVSYSEELPARYVQQLHKASQKYPWLVLDKRTASNREGRSLEAVVEKNFDPGTIYGSFRLDDDDVLSVDYFEQTAPYVRAEFVQMVVSLGRGIQAFYDGDRFVNPRVEYRPKIALGLMNICEYTAQRSFVTPEAISHTWLDYKNAVILDSRRLSYLHTLHPTQDTHVGRQEGDFDRRVRAHMKFPKIPADIDTKILFPTVEFGEVPELSEIVPL